jgi:hypothetical protein
MAFPSSWTLMASSSMRVAPRRVAFTFSATGLSSGVNLLVIHARDRDSSSYVDAKVEAAVSD